MGLGGSRRSEPVTTGAQPGDRRVAESQVLRICTLSHIREKSLKTKTQKLSFADVFLSFHFSRFLACMLEQEAERLLSPGMPPDPGDAPVLLELRADHGHSFALLASHPLHFAVDFLL